MRATTRVLCGSLVAAVFSVCLPGTIALAGKGPTRPAADDQSVFGSGDSDEEGGEEVVPDDRTGRHAGRSPKPFWGESDADWTPDTVSASGGIGVGAGYLGAELTLALGYGRFTEFLLSGYYRQESIDDQESTVYGPELGPRFKLPNPTILTPFVGAGVGNEFWSRRDGGKEFDRNRSVTTYADVGLEARVTKGFGLSIAEKWVYYAERSPTLFRDHTLSEPRLVRRIQVGFVVHF